MHIYVYSVCVYTYIYIYIYRERERERERDTYSSDVAVPVDNPVSCAALCERSAFEVPEAGASDQTPGILAGRGQPRRRHKNNFLRCKSLP